MATPTLPPDPGPLLDPVSVCSYCGICDYCGLGRTTDTEHHGTVTVDHTWCEAEYLASIEDDEEEAA